MSDLAPIPLQNGYISLEITTDPNALMQAAVLAIAAQFPGWVPQEGQLDQALLEQYAQMAAETANVAPSMAAAAFQYLGQGLFGVPPLIGEYATAPTTWTMIDDSGYTVPAGTVVAYMVQGNNEVQFQTTEDFAVPNGETATSPGAVTIQAVVAGAANNGITDTTSIVPVQQLAYVSSIVATGTTAGGVDPETETAYLNRLSNLLQLSAPRPIQPGDFALLASSATDGDGNPLEVARAVAINLLNPGRTITEAALTDSSDVISDPDLSFTNADIGRSVTGTGIPSDTTISSVNTAGRTLSAASLTNGSANLTCSSADFTTNDIGRTVSGTGVPSGTTISSITSTTVAVMTAEATSSESSESIVLGALVNCETAVMSANATASESSESVVLGDLTGQERCVTVCGVNADGSALSDEVQSELSAYLQAKREINFLVPVISPTYTEIDVTWAAVGASGYSTDVVTVAVNAALANWLSPAVWGGGSDDPPIWDPTATTVRFNALVALIASTPGVAYVSSLTFGIHGDSLGTSDIDLPGDAPLTTGGTISGSVTSG